MSAHFLDVLQGLTTLKMMGRSRDQIDTIAQVTARFRDATLSVLRVAFLSAFALEMVATISTAVVAVEIGLRLLYGHLSFEQAFFVLILAPEFYLPLRLLGTRFHAGTAGVAAAQRIFAILATEDGGPMPVDGRPWTDKGRRTKDERRTAASSVLRPPSSVFRPSLRIRFEDVHYAYAEEDRPALSELSFEIEPGQRVALAGPSGSGKSTVAHLLLRFMAPTRGLITVDGVPLSDLALAEWRAQVAWVPQMPYLFHDTVAANIRLARPDASRDDVSAAARLAHAHSFIEQLPLGYDTVIGERGARLSGGQAQRLALARAFLKDAPFLILDEASANLDPEHVALLQESIDRLAAGRTLLVIAHRLSTLRQADQIIVLADGHAVEVGTHATLLQRDGLYRRLALAHGGVA
jgi:thiol reductant ABC exporter CydD subunit